MRRAEILAVVFGLLLLGCTDDGATGTPASATPSQRQAWEDLYALGLHDLVQERLEAHLRGQPRDTEAWALRLRCLTALGRTPERLAALEEMSRALPERRPELALERLRLLIDLWDLPGCQDLIAAEKNPPPAMQELARQLAPLFDPRPVYQEDFREPLDPQWRISCPLELAREAGELRLRYHQFFAARAGRVVDWDGEWLQARWEFSVSRLDWAQGLFIGVFAEQGAARLGLHLGAGGAYGGSNAALRRTMSLWVAQEGSLANGGATARGAPPVLEIDQRYRARLDYLAAQGRAHLVLTPLPGPGRDIVLEVRDALAFPAGRYGFGVAHDRGQGQEDFLVEGRLDSLRLALAPPPGSTALPTSADDPELQAARALVDGDPGRAIECYDRLVQSGVIALDAAVYRIAACQLARRPEAMKAALEATLKADRAGTAERLLIYRGLLPPGPPEVQAIYRELAKYYEGPLFKLDRARAAAREGLLDDAFEYLAEAAQRGLRGRAALEADPTLAPLRADPRWPKLRERFASEGAEDER